MNFLIKPFKPKWNKIKRNLNDMDLELFYEVIDIDGSIGRRIYPGCGREDNPRFYMHWFSHGRCHWNVVLPCFIMNKRNISGHFKIITNDKHSAIINTITNEIYDPTYEYDKETTLMQFTDGYEIKELFEHSITLSEDIFKRSLDFIMKYYHKEKVDDFIKILENKLNSLHPK